MVSAFYEMSAARVLLGCGDVARRSIFHAREGKDGEGEGSGESNGMRGRLGFGKMRFQSPRKL